MYNMRIFTPAILELSIIVDPLLTTELHNNDLQLNLEVDLLSKDSTLVFVSQIISICLTLIAQHKN